VIDLPTDKMPIGKGEKNNSFTLHTIDTQKGDMLYFYTDGYADQFGGPKGKKFKYKQLHELLVSAHKLPMEEQKQILLVTIEKWKGDLEQVDDILLIGMRI
ncbi:MAG: SpoIIE family protein phosphatase, partial [Bacteroidetes bacterium]|nr:SpoIIE family protein phosphatase [Bacteroidota bacterium]